MKRGKYAKAALYKYLYGSKFIGRGYNARRLKKMLKKTRSSYTPATFSVVYNLPKTAKLIHQLHSHLAEHMEVIMLDDRSRKYTIS